MRKIRNIGKSSNTFKSSWVKKKPWAKSETILNWMIVKIHLIKLGGKQLKQSIDGNVQALNALIEYEKDV